MHVVMKVTVDTNYFLVFAFTSFCQIPKMCAFFLNSFLLGMVGVYSSEGKMYDKCYDKILHICLITFHTSELTS